MNRKLKIALILAIAICLPGGCLALMFLRKKDILPDSSNEQSNADANVATNDVNNEAK